MMRETGVCRRTTLRLSAKPLERTAIIKRRRRMSEPRTVCVASSSPTETAWPLPHKAVRECVKRCLAPFEVEICDLKVKRFK